MYIYIIYIYIYVAINHHFKHIFRTPPEYRTPWTRTLKKVREDQVARAVAWAQKQHIAKQGTPCYASKCRWFVKLFNWNYLIIFTLLCVYVLKGLLLFFSAGGVSQVHLRVSGMRWNCLGLHLNIYIYIYIKNRYDDLRYFQWKINKPVVFFFLFLWGQKWKLPLPSFPS